MHHVPVKIDVDGLKAARRARMGALGNQFMATTGDALIGARAGSFIFPGIGTAIGAGIGLIGSLFGPAKEGRAAETWDDMVNHGYLFNTPGTKFDDRYFGEALKGAMDKGNNVWPACGSDGHKNPDCFYSALAQTIIAGYKNHLIPLNASTSQVYNTVVVPWLKSGANGLFNWNNFSHEATKNQALLIQAAVDRYIHGLPITRANMPAYASESGAYSQWSTPSLAVALQSLIAASQTANSATTSAPATSAPATSTSFPAVNSQSPKPSILPGAPPSRLIPVFQRSPATAPTVAAPTVAAPTVAAPTVAAPTASPSVDPFNPALYATPPSAPTIITLPGQNAPTYAPPVSGTPTMLYALGGIAVVALLLRRRD